MSDPTFIIEENGGDLVFEGSDLQLSNGLEGAVVLSLFGGNQEDGGGQGDDAKQFWGNHIEPDNEEEKLRSQTQYLLDRIPATSGNLLRVQDAAQRDLAWMAEEVAQTITVEVQLTGVKRVLFTIEITVNGEQFNFDLTREWGGSA